VSIYTRTGDDGTTGLFGGGRVPKDDPRVDAYGEVDELNAALGVARSTNLPPDIDKHCANLQNQLFTVGSQLATPLDSKARVHIPKIETSWAQDMEQAIDGYDRELPALTNFILPGGSAGASALHLARCVCRRAERKIIALHRDKLIEPEVVVYLNRLSDFLFTLARAANLRAGRPDVPWKLS
jgi:cob(I)alamin adenosyltransferase